MYSEDELGEDATESASDNQSNLSADEPMDCDFDPTAGLEDLPERPSLLYPHQENYFMNLEDEVEQRRSGARNCLKARLEQIKSNMGVAFHFVRWSKHTRTYRV